MPNVQTGHKDWLNWSFDWDVPDSEGLTLRDGFFKGVQVFYKFSLPVIRVKYLRDEGLLSDLAGGGAGPFADQISWKLGGDHGLQKAPENNKEYIGLIEHDFGVLGLWLKVAVYARIGAYHIKQEWWLSERGVILPRVWSKGLFINLNHTHHPYWRLDFDVDGHGNNRVYVKDNETWHVYNSESNDRKQNYGKPQWYVENTQSQKGVWIIPGLSDGHPDEFSQNDVAIRLYHESEEQNPWRWGTHGLGLLHPKAEPLTDSSDIVFWYIAHLFHDASDKGNVFHSAGPAISVDWA